MQSLATIVKDTIVCLNDIHFLFFLANMTWFHSMWKYPWQIWQGLIHTVWAEDSEWYFWDSLLKGSRCSTHHFHDLVICFVHSHFFAWETGTGIRHIQSSWNHDLKSPTKQNVVESRKKTESQWHHGAINKVHTSLLQILCYTTKISFYWMETLLFFFQCSVFQKRT